jgi:hypothetical protein
MWHPQEMPCGTTQEAPHVSTTVIGQATSSCEKENNRNHVPQSEGDMWHPENAHCYPVNKFCFKKRIGGSTKSDRPCQIYVSIGSITNRAAKISGVFNHG